MPEAVWFSAPRRVEIRDEALPPLGPADAHVRAVVSGVSAGSELLVYRGEAPADLKPDLPTIAGAFGFPVKFGYASVGRVVRTGDQVEEPRIDDLVFVHYPHQSEFVVPASAAVLLPSGLSPEIGVFSANLETAVTVVLDARPRLSEVVLVTGQGVVGLLVTMLLKRAGAGSVVTVDSHARRREASIGAGADLAVAPDDDVRGAVEELTGGRGADVAIEASGSPAGLQTCIDAAAYAGTVVAASWYGIRPVALTLGGAFHRKRLRVLSSQVSTLDPAIAARWDRARRTRLVTDLLCELPLSGLVTHRFPRRDAAAAYELLDQRPEECMQVVLEHD